MARSGSYNFVLTLDQLIKDAFYEINIYGIGDQIDARDYQFAKRKANRLIKAWHRRGARIWNRRRATLFTDYQTEKYTIDSDGDNCTLSYNDTTLSAAEALGQTVLSVTSSSGMTAADNVGIKLDDKTRQWTTIASVDSSTQITVDTALTAGAASGNTVVAYTTKIQSVPLNIVQMTVVDLASEKRSQKMGRYSHDEYYDLSDRFINSRSSRWYYDKYLDGGELYLYPRPDDVNDIIEFTYHESVEDLDSATDAVDFPSEWFEALVLNLAVSLATPYGMVALMEKLEPRAERTLGLAFWYDSDDESITMRSV